MNGNRIPKAIVLTLLSPVCGPTAVVKTHTTLVLRSKIAC